MLATLLQLFQGLLPARPILGEGCVTPNQIQLLPTVFQLAITVRRSAKWLEIAMDTSTQHAQSQEQTRVKRHLQRIKRGWLVH